MWIGRVMKGMEASTQASGALDERFGKPTAFTPSGDGAVPSARMEAFLAVREATAPARVSIAGFFDSLPTREEAEAMDKAPFTEKLVKGFGFARTGMGIPTALADFFKIRDESLLAQEMGMGEYTYIYVLAYQSWLGHPPGDGPLRDDSPGAAPVPPRVLVRIQSDLLTILENQAAALPVDTPQARRDQLAAEIAAMKEDSGRIPWKDGVPDAVAVSFEPYRDRLEASYARATNVFELARNRRHGRFSYEAE
jgi:hypothetical protein